MDQVSTEAKWKIGEKIPAAWRIYFLKARRLKEDRRSKTAGKIERAEGGPDLHTFTGGSGVSAFLKVGEFPAALNRVEVVSLDPHKLADFGGFSRVVLQLKVCHFEYRKPSAATESAKYRIFGNSGTGGNSGKPQGYLKNSGTRGNSRVAELLGKIVAYVPQFLKIRNLIIL